jgi:hypothetical protein
MNTEIKTSQDLFKEVGDLLRDVSSRLKIPESLIRQQSQEELFYSMLYRIRRIVESEPWLRSEAVRTLHKCNQSSNQDVETSGCKHFKIEL